ncbi:ABC transporter ATP-binding protein [Alloiococcus sp. CFN-8]|uniref:ABC transporter ATP-binding protein n=1 Tax=Alloiococcus sp. CFN-8 TaxID=3416081 RepID=UPI003CF40C09
MKQFASNFAAFMKTAWKIEKKYFLYLFLSFIGTSTFSYCIIQLPKIVLDMIDLLEIDIQKLIILFSVLLISAFLSSFSKVLYSPIGLTIRYHYLLKISEQYISIPFEEYDNPKNQSNVWQIMRPVNSIDGIQAFYTNIAQLFGNLGVLFVAIGIIFRIELGISMMILAWFFIYTVLSIKAANKVDDEWNKAITLNREQWYLDDIAVDVAYGKEIRVFQLQNWLQNKLSVLNDKLNKLFRKNETTLMIPGILDDVYQFIRDSLIYIFLITMYFRKDIGIGEFASYSLMISQLNRALFTGADNIKQILSKHDNYKRMLEFIDIPKQCNEGIPIDGSSSWSISFEDVSFKYPNSEKWIYKNLDFTIKKGSKIAIVGLNGVGKTTLLKLLLRLYKPTEGKITLNGIDINEYKLNDYFQLFAPVFQEINIFPFTIRDNMTFGSDIDDETLLQAIKDAGLEEDRFEKAKLDSTYMTRYLHQDGLNLSGGQAQKFATARAFASKRSVYILDEPTSALDAVAEYEFYHQVETNMREQTVLFVSHRLASTQFCDEILLIEDETISEKGSHRELLEKDGRYAELFKMQAKYYQKEEAL